MRPGCHRHSRRAIWEQWQQRYGQAGWTPNTCGGTGPSLTTGEKHAEQAARGEEVPSSRCLNASATYSQPNAEHSPPASDDNALCRSSALLWRLGACFSISLPRVGCPTRMLRNSPDLSTSPGRANCGVYRSCSHHARPGIGMVRCTYWNIPKDCSYICPYATVTHTRSGQLQFLG